MTAPAQPTWTEIEFEVFAEPSRLLQAKWLGGHAKPAEIERFYNTSGNSDVSANSTYAWGDTNQNAATRAALWTGSFSAAIMPLTQAPE